jgi:hypothetical protein
MMRSLSVTWFCPNNLAHRLPEVTSQHLLLSNLECDTWHHVVIVLIKPLLIVIHIFDHVIKPDTFKGSRLQLKITVKIASYNMHAFQGS